MKMEDVIKWAAIAVGAYVVYVYVLEPLMAGTLFPTTGTGATGTSATGTTGTAATGLTNITTPPATVPTGSISTNQTPSVTIANNSGGSNSNFNVGDNFTVVVTGPANSAVVVTGTQNGQPFSVNEGTTNAVGQLIIQGTMPAGNQGPWVENWTVGGQSVGSLSFQVGTTSTAGSNPSNIPANTSLASALQITSGGASMLTPDQWSYYYAQLPGRVSIPPSTFDAMLASAGITDRTQAISLGAFVTMVVGAGLSGVNLGDIVPVNGNMIGLGAANPPAGFRAKGKTNGFGGSRRRVSAPNAPLTVH